MTGGDAMRQLAADLRSVNVEALGRPVMTKAGAVMRDRAKADAPTGPHIPRYAASIVFNKPSPLVVEVGAREAGQGNLSAVLEYGQGPNAPHPHIVPQLDREAGPTAEWLAKVIAEGLAR